MHEIWDVIVLTSIDERQKKVYESQLLDASKKGKIPHGTICRVYADDPPGIKIGGGGATLLCLGKLKEEMGERMHQQRILLIHAGGYSQRQPNCSFTGKIFSLVPKETLSGRPMTLFDLKLEIYSKFLPKMPHGVFLASSDTLEAFSLPSGEKWSFNEEGFTVLAHPSSLEVGQTHGVYVLAPRSTTEQEVYMAECEKVLQKPSVEEMKAAGAVHQRGEEEIVYTDSAYFMAVPVLKRLEQFYKEEKASIVYELDPYGDYLQPLGSKADIDFTFDNRRVAPKSHEEAAALTELRQKLYLALHSFPISALVLESSKFYHLGTFAEMMQHFCVETDFREHFGTLKTPFSYPSSLQEEKDCCAMQSLLAQDQILPQKSIIEFCDIPITFKLQENTILSNCSCDQPFEVPLPVFLMTVPIGSDGKQFVTVFFGTEDNLKAKADAKHLHFAKTTLRHAMKKLGIPRPSEDEKTTLWAAKLFPIRSDRKSSFLCAIQALKCLHTHGHKEQSPIEPEEELMSMENLLEKCDSMSILQYQSDLRGKIGSLKMKER